MEIWAAGVVLVGLVIPATTTVIVTGLALKNTHSRDRAAILHEVAQLVQALRKRR